MFRLRVPILELENACRILAPRPAKRGQKREGLTRSSTTITTERPRLKQAPVLHSPIVRLLGTLGRSGVTFRSSLIGVECDDQFKRLIAPRRHYSGAILASLVAVGMSYQLVEMALDARRFHQIGKSVDIGGYKLNIECSGQGSPTIILEAGLEELSINWRLVQPDIAKFTRVCSYDRAGYGWSDVGPMPRSSTQIARELHALFQSANEKPPFLMVGHSFGAVLVRVYNGLYPGDVAGMVLVDGGPDDLSLPASIKKLSDADLGRRKRDRSWTSLRYGLGISRFLARKNIDDAAKTITSREWWYFSIEPKFVEATTNEVENLGNL